MDRLRDGNHVGPLSRAHLVADEDGERATRRRPPAPHLVADEDGERATRRRPCAPPAPHLVADEDGDRATRRRPCAAPAPHLVACASPAPHLVADEDGERAIGRRPCAPPAPHVCRGNDVNCCAACGRCLAAAAPGGAPASAPRVIGEPPERSSFENVCARTYLIVVPTPERPGSRGTIRIMLEWCEAAAEVRPADDLDGHYVRSRCPGDTNDGVFRVLGVGWIVALPAAARGDSTLIMPHAGDSGTSDGRQGAAIDILLVQPRGGRVSRSCLGALCRYWLGVIGQWLKKTKLYDGCPDDLPKAWTWERIMGRPIYQPRDVNGRGDGACVICACAVCIHAQHRLAFERRYGAGTFPYELSDVHYLKYACWKAGVWRPGSGAWPLDILNFMKKDGIALRTEYVPGWRRCLLRFESAFEFSRSNYSPRALATMMRQKGPILGALYMGPNYWHTGVDPQYVYPGEMGRANHLVVCMAYELAPVQVAGGKQKEDLRVHILDNHLKEGPLRWINFEAFDKFVYIRVEPLDRRDLRIAMPPNRILP